MRSPPVFEFIGNWCGGLLYRHAACAGRMNMECLEEPRTETDGYGYGDFGFVWQEITNSAEQLAGQDGFLQCTLQHNVLSCSSPEEILATVLSNRLGNSSLPASALYRLFRDVLGTFPEVLEATTEDLLAVDERDPACPDFLHVLMHLKGFHAMQTYRVANKLWEQGRKEVAAGLQSQASLVFGVDIHPAAKIGSGIMLDHGVGVVIGETAVVEDQVSIMQNVTLGGTGKDMGDRHPKVRKGVLIGAGASILGNIEVGEQSKVAAGSVVLKDVPAYCTVAGVPAKVVRYHYVASSPACVMDQTI
jgi:serine O-acetyltransferase